MIGTPTGHGNGQDTSCAETREELAMSQEQASQVGRRKAQARGGRVMRGSEKQKKLTESIR